MSWSRWRPDEHRELALQAWVSKPDGMPSNVRYSLLGHSVQRRERAGTYTFSCWACPWAVVHRPRLALIERREAPSVLELWRSSLYNKLCVPPVEGGSVKLFSIFHTTCAWRNAELLKHPALKRAIHSKSWPLTLAILQRGHDNAFACNLRSAFVRPLYGHVLQSMRVIWPVRAGCLHWAMICV